jgi:hypothetical protein
VVTVAVAVLTVATDRSVYYLRDVYTECIFARVSVPLTLLGLLEREPSHGYDLKRDYDAYFGRGRQLPFGQVYSTLAGWPATARSSAARPSRARGRAACRAHKADAGTHRPQAQRFAG